jgi:peptidase M24-like protein
MTAAVASELIAKRRGFREVQRLAYECAEAVAAQLKPGVTEREAARMQREWLRERGVRDWFHLPFAWFGDRTAFAGFRIPLQFFPTGRRLEPGMPFILDLAPIYEGYARGRRLLRLSGPQSGARTAARRAGQGAPLVRRMSSGSARRA